MTLYFSVNGGRGLMPFKVKITDASGAVIGEVTGQINFEDPLRDYSAHVVFDGMPVSQEGVVLLEVLFGNHMVGSRQLTITRMRQPVT